MSTTGRARRSGERGSVLPFVTVGLVALLGVSALALDAGLLWTARTQLQAAVDASALAAAASLIDPAGPTVTATAAEMAAAAVASANSAVPAASVELAAVRIGRWETGARRFDATVDTTDPDQVNAVDVRARLDGAPNRAVPAMLARVLGREAFTVSAEATAWLGFAGNAPPGTVDLPITIDCCAIQGPGCANDYCDTIATEPPDSCEIEPSLVQGSGLPQHHDDPVTHPLSCILFHSTPLQNACWTNFEPPSNPNINAADLRRLVDSGNTFELGAGDELALNNGNMTPVLRNIERRFNTEGRDRYAPFDGQTDSWVVRLPVVSCQQIEPPCRQGEIRGFLCFEVRQIEVVPAQALRGRFLCRERDAELFADCAVAGSGPGGSDFGIRAEIPVLVR